MNIVKKEVLLLKAQEGDGNDKYETLLVKNGFSVKHLQLLDFKYVNNTLLKEKLNNVDIYNGIIFTSPRAVFATQLSVDDKRIDEKWFKKNNFVVGHTTYDLVQEELGIICKGRDCGNAYNLATLIIEENRTENYEKFLFPCGNLKRETLAKCLNAHNIEVDTTTVYETVQNPNIMENFKLITSNFKYISEYIVYFSPSGVKYTTNIFKESNVAFENLKLVAIGPSTEEALKSENLPVFSVAQKPTDEELLNAIFKKH